MLELLIGRDSHSDAHNVSPEQDIVSLHLLGGDVTHEVLKLAFVAKNEFPAFSMVSRACYSNVSSVTVWSQTSKWESEESNLDVFQSEQGEAEYQTECEERGNE